MVSLPPSIIVPVFSLHASVILYFLAPHTVLTILPSLFDIVIRILSHPGPSHHYIACTVFILTPLTTFILLLRQPNNYECLHVQPINGNIYAVNYKG